MGETALWKNGLWMLVTILLSAALSLGAVYVWTGNQMRADRSVSIEPEAGEEMHAATHAMMGMEMEDLPIKIPGGRIVQLPYEEIGKVKMFRLSAEPIRWEYAQGQYVTAWGYNSQIPGPEIRVQEGDRVRVVFTNDLPQPTTIHWHGVDVPYTQDGVPGISQQPIQPGETFTYEFEAQPVGTRFYHTHGSSHQDEAQQLDMGLSGAFIIEPRDSANKSTYDNEYVLLLDEWEVMPDGTNAAMIAGGHGMGGHSMEYNVFTLNGRAFPDTEPLQVKQGERVRLRVINAGTSTSHPMHLHGHSFRIVAVDGNDVPEGAQLIRDTITVNPGERYDLDVVADNPGAWVFHCHELHHADGGMIVPFLYEGFNATPESPPGNGMAGMGHGMH